MVAALAGILVLATVPTAEAGSITPDAAADATAWNSQRKIARDSFGRLYVALLVTDTALGEAVRVFRSGDGGRTWSPLPRVPDAANSMSRGSLAFDGRDRLHLAWTEAVGGDLQVFHAEWTGTGWQPRTQVSTTPGYSGFPAIAADRQHRLHVAWYGFDGTTYQVYYRARTGSAWGPPETVSTGLQDANNPALAVGPDDGPHVAWSFVAGFRWSVVYTNREDRWAPAMTISNTTNRALDPSLAVGSDSRVFATWTEENPNGTRAVVARVRTGMTWGPPFALAWFTAPGGHPAVALDGSGGAFVVWDQLDAAIRYRAYNGSWGPTQAFSANGTASFPAARWAAIANPLFPGANRIDVVWTEAANGSYSAVLAGIPVPSVGTAPTTSTDGATAFTIPAFILVVVALVVWRWRVRRHNGPPG